MSSMIDDSHAGLHVVAALYRLPGPRPVYIGAGEIFAVAEPCNLAGAVAIADQLPAAIHPDGVDIQGIGVYPPRDRGYAVTVHPGTRDAWGRPVPGGARNGAIMCIFRDLRGVVIRASLAGDAREPAIAPCDLRPADIAGVPGRFGFDNQGRPVEIPARILGWEVARLDVAPVHKPAILAGRLPGPGAPREG